MRRLSKVLVTGGAGFIGSRLVDKLVCKGYSVVVLDNLCSGSRRNLRSHLDCDDFRLVKGDVRDREDVGDAMDGVDAVVHLAALIDVESSVNSPFETHDVNVSGTLSVLSEAVERGVRRFLFASSAAVYGDGSLPPLREDFPPKPISPYAASKVAAELYCQAFNRSYGLGTVILRYFNVYGPRREFSPSGGVVERFLSNALGGKPLVVFGDGKQSRDFIYLDDVIEATMLALESDNPHGKVLNICTGRPATLNELVDLVQEIVGKEIETKYFVERRGDVRYNYGDPAKAEEVIGFKAKVDLKMGLELTKRRLRRKC